MTFRAVTIDYLDPDLETDFLFFNVIINKLFDLEIVNL